MKFKIPAHVKIKNKLIAEVVWVDTFQDPDTLAEYRYPHKGDKNQTRQIALLKSLEGRKLYVQFIHELLHAIELERGVKISHSAIYQLADAIYYLIFHNDWEAND